MKKYTASQQAVFTAIKEGNKSFFNGDSSKVYSLVTGCNGAAIRSLLKAGVIEKFNHKIYTQYYRVVTK